MCWLAAPADTVVLGAAGVLFGWLGYVIARAWFGRKPLWIGIAVAVLCVFSSTLLGVLPHGGRHVFWGGQLAGFLTGVGLAWLLHGRHTRRPVAGPGLPS